MENEEIPTELIIGKDIQLEKISEIFPKTNEPSEYLRITDVGLYSITKKNEAYFISNLITKYFGETKITITDSTACCGGNTISFLLHPQIMMINSIELNQLHFNILKNNIKLYKNCTKVNLINGNFIDYMNELKQDVIFYDLPWGGVKYGEKESITLGLYKNNEFMNIAEIINILKENCKLQVLKIPLNFDFTNFLKDIEYTKIKIHKIYNKFTKKLGYFILILIS